MKQKILSVEAIQTAIARLSDRSVNFRIDLASTPHVARRIIQTLPGVKELSENGPQVADALLSLLQDDQTLQNENLASISLHILEYYPSERVKLALAKPISQRKFTGFNAQFAAEAFLKAAGIETSRKEAIAAALSEARKLHPASSQKIKTENKVVPNKLSPKLGRKKALGAKTSPKK